MAKSSLSPHRLRLLRNRPPVRNFWKVTRRGCDVPLLSSPSRSGTVIRLLVLAGLILAALPFPPAVRAQTVAEIAETCRRVGDVPSREGAAQFIRIDPAAAAQLAEIGLDRAAIFERMAETAIPETMGCWAMPVGNFDSQLISVGMSQWNYGTGSLQPVLGQWRDSFGSRRRFRQALSALAPTYGALLFSRDCLAVPVREPCRAAILAAHDAQGQLDPVLRAELTEIFESDAMLQVQADAYVRLLLFVRGELLRVFPAGPITMRKVRWAIDTIVQQSRLPPDEDIARLRRRLSAHAAGRALAAAARDLRLVRGDRPDRRPGRHRARLCVERRAMALHDRLGADRSGAIRAPPPHLPEEPHRDRQ